MNDVQAVVAWVIGRIVRRARADRQELHDAVAHNVSVMVIQATAPNCVLAGGQ